MAYEIRKEEVQEKKPTSNLLVSCSVCCELQSSFAFIKALGSADKMTWFIRQIQKKKKEKKNKKDLLRNNIAI